MRGNSKLKVAIALLATTSLALSACGRSDDGDDTSTPAPPGTGTDQTAEPAGDPTPGPGFDGTTIRLGVITPESGTASVIGNPLTNGNKVYFDRINEAGGIAGKYQVELVTVDSKYEQPTAVQVYADTKGDVAMYVQILGTPIVDTLLPQLEADGIFAGPASLDAFWVREQNLMPIGAPYQIQAMNALDYAQRELDADDSTVCAATKDDAYGETGLAGLEYAADELGIDIAESVTFGASGPFEAVVDRLIGANCDIVWLTALPTESIPILTDAAAKDFAPSWLGQSPTYVTAMADGGLAPYLAETFYLMSEGPQWGDDSVPGMAQMLEDIEAYAPDQAPDIYFSFGYVQAWAAAQILEKAVELGDLSPAGIIAASEQVGTLTFEGLIGDYVYGPAEDRVPPRESSVFRVNPEFPGGLEAIEVDFVSEVAEGYDFD